LELFLGNMYGSTTKSINLLKLLCRFLCQKNRIRSLNRIERLWTWIRKNTTEAGSATLVVAALFFFFFKYCDLCQAANRRRKELSYLSSYVSACSRAATLAVKQKMDDILDTR
jgi:hypothetical protein